jgi:hypothetical protein
VLQFRCNRLQDSEVASLVAELNGLGSLEAGLPATSPVPDAAEAARTADTTPAPASGSLPSADHSPTVSLPAASAWLPVDPSGSATTSPELVNRLPSPLAAASAAASPTSHDCFDVRPSSGPSSLGPCPAAELATPVGNRTGRCPLQQSPCSPAAGELSLAPASPASPDAQPSPGAQSATGHDAAAAEDAADTAGSDSSDESSPDSDAEDGTWLPEFATPAQRRSGRRVRLKVGAPLFAPNTSVRRIICLHVFDTLHTDVTILQADDSISKLDLLLYTCAHTWKLHRCRGLATAAHQPDGDAAAVLPRVAAAGLCKRCRRRYQLYLQPACPCTYNMYLVWAFPRCSTSTRTLCAFLPIRQASREALLLAAVNADRKGAGRELLPRLTMRALRGFLRGKTVGGRPWAPPTPCCRDDLVTDAM